MTHLLQAQVPGQPPGLPCRHSSSSLCLPLHRPQPPLCLQTSPAKLKHCYNTITAVLQYHYSSVMIPLQQCYHQQYSSNAAGLRYHYSSITAVLCSVPRKVPRVSTMPPKCNQWKGLGAWRVSLPVVTGAVAASTMVVLKWVWLKDAATLLLMRSISLKVSSFPCATCNTSKSVTFF